MGKTIKLKRGNKVNLPILKNGELGYTLDSKELFVGDGNANYNLSILENNLIINSNFCIPAYNDNEKITIPAGTGQYFMGNYYITSSSQVNVTKSYNGFAGFNSTGPFTLEYREKINTADGLPFDNQIMTLSFDIVNNGSSAIVMNGGAGSNKVTFTVPVGKSRQVFSFNMTYPTLNISAITIINISGNQTFNIQVGNIKLEKGIGNINNTSLSPTYLDSAALNMLFRTCGGTYRVVKVDTNTLTFYIPCYINKYLVKNSAVTLNNISNLAIYDKLGILQLGFTTNVSFNSDNCISVVATRTLHGLTDAYINIKFDTYLI